jgi:hypothetical protein
MAKVAFCIVAGHPQAVKVVDELKSAGISVKDISVLLYDTSNSFGSSEETQARIHEAGTIAGARIGCLPGGTLRLLFRIDTPAIPPASPVTALGPFIAAGPIAGTLSVTALEVAVGGISVTLLELGLPELAAKRYETKLDEGHVLVSVHLDAPEQTQRVRETFQRAGAQDICFSTEAIVHAPRAVRDAGRRAELVSH